MTQSKIRIAVIGMGFGRSFAEIYRHHPGVEYVGICDSNQRIVETFSADDYRFKHTDLREVLEGDLYDAVHLCLPVTMHVEPTLLALRSGKHVACAVPMAQSIADLERIIDEQQRTHLNYMMMETMVYGRNYFFAKDLYQNNRLGEIQFLRGCHSQDLEEINPVWRGLPPMWYMTHAVSPLLDILDTQATEVCCFGSGTMRSEFHAAYGNPYPIETAIFTLRDSQVKVEITRTLFETAPYGGEAFDIYGSLGTFATIGREESPILWEISPLKQTGEQRRISSTIMPNIPYQPELLPEPIQSYASGGHGGSHPHLAHEFVRSIIEHRSPYIHAKRAANWCAPGICAHESAMKNGVKIQIPLFD